jgi:hypothetical protein
VQYLTIENPWVFDQDGLGQSHDLWNVHPMIGAFYGRDRLEFEGFVCNIGLRADYWFIGREAKTRWPDTTRGNIAPTTRTSFYEDTKSFFGRRVKMHVSPRVIVAHPITENSSFFFNYGEFTQNPSYRYVYSKLNSISSESFPLQGNPNLNPQVSVNYEVGAKHQFLSTARRTSRSSSATCTTIRARRAWTRSPAPTSSRTSSTQRPLRPLQGLRDRAREAARELLGRQGHVLLPADARQEQRPQRGARAAGSGRQQRDAPVRGVRALEPAEQADREHGPALRRQDPDFFRWAKRSGLNVYVQGQSGRSYTPKDINNLNPIGLPNSKNAPMQTTCDVKINRWFLLGTRRFDISVQGLNIFNNYLYNRVDAITGSAASGAGRIRPLRTSPA